MATAARHNLVSLLTERVKGDPEAPALAVKQAGKYRWRSWREIAADVRRMAARLQSLGVSPGDRVALFSENRYEWIVTDLAVHLCRAVQVAMHNSLSGAQVAYQIVDSEAKLLIVAGSSQVDKLRAVQQSLPAALRWASFEPIAEPIADRQILSLEEVFRAPTDLPELMPDSRDLMTSFGEPPAPEDLATILYTSGTTGEPKGVMLSHGNLASNALASLAAFGHPPDELRMCWLPLSHIYARTSDLYVWLVGCGRLALAESRETLLADCAAVQPTFINGVPYFYEKVARHLEDQGRAAESGALRALLGGRLKSCCSGGAALANHVAELFARQDIKLVQGYGLTETSPVITTGTPQDHRLGTVGRPLAGVEVRIAADGEILTRGPHVMLGYWKRPEETATAIVDGWFHTGDLGQLEDGYLRITGRKKELIVTAGGKNIAPAYLEGLLTEDPLITQAFVVGEGHKFLGALLVPDLQRLRSEIERRQIELGSPEEMLSHRDVLALYAAVIERQLAHVSRDEQVRKFVLLPRGFTIESEELTPTLKLRREVVLRNFSEQIAALFANERSVAEKCDAEPAAEAGV